MEFGVFLQCYKQPFATYNALRSVRNHYPTCTIVIVSDNGYDYTEMAKHFNCVYIHSTVGLNCQFSNEDIKNGIQSIDYYKDHIKRTADGFQLITEPYVMILEDDVSINHKITDTFKYDLNGFCPNQINIEGLKHKYPILNKANTYRFSGHGGSIYNKQSFLAAIQNKEIIHDLLTNWSTYNFCSNICQDLLWSILIILNGGTVGPYHGHYDCSYLNEQIVVQHQYKVYYNVNMPQQLKYLVKMT